ncbi:methylated-DNA--[protein]-cysteine S-methyltransferase [Corynebacterium sp. UBA2622]|uniref:methylated-DNA--[protein]-cysteine S-methyltransferase n=1 Tax=Corynebacterium sp. UBA2622 TaxID=1946393 RepID=UPI0025BD83DD|nr:methylated-DNA--[protein]-cysteine S-methyltransferase [Corynebacterium sp. UBA2622]
MESYTWCELDSPVGKLLAVRSDRGLVRVVFEREGFAEELAKLSGEQREALDAEAAAQFAGYFAGARKEFTLPLDWSLTGGFREEVQRAMLGIPYGSTVSYGELARHLGHPGANRAVGTGCARNPLPIVVPCHRVTRSGGAPGNYLAGPDVKKHLLNLEAAHA